MRVLIIEDHLIVADMLSMVLQVEGFIVDVATGGEEGLELAQRSEPDVIVLDVMMPNVDGWSVAEALTQDPALASIPIVFCTAKADEDSTRRAKQFAAASYVTKPFDNEALISELIRVTHPISPSGSASRRDRVWTSDASATAERPTAAVATSRDG